MSTPAIDLDALLRRLHLPTVRRLYPELAQRAEPEGLSYRDFLALLVAEEVAHRAQTRIQRCVRRARFPYLKTIEEFDFTFQASVRLALLGSLLSPELVTQGHCLIASGPSGTGKTHLAVAIAYRAIQNGFDALFVPDDGKMYLVDDPKKLEPHAGENVVVKGTVSADGKSIQVSSVRKSEASR
jgi:DNA replication protein DnaC